MGLIDRLEKRFGQYALPNLTMWLLIGQVMVYAAQYIGPRAQMGGAVDIYLGLVLDPQKVYSGEWWRLLTFPFLAPLGRYPLFVIFYFLIFYYLGFTLETAWGSFKYNAYLAIGYLATVGAALIADGIAPGAGVTVGDYLYGSLFLAFARLFPDYQIYLFFVLPVKVRYLAWLWWAGYLLQMIFGAWNDRMMATAAVANYLFFFGQETVKDARYRHRRVKHKAKTLKAAQAVLHECRVCGITSQMAPKMRFRYRSEDGESRCYCSDCLKGLERVAEE